MKIRLSQKTTQGISFTLVLILILETILPTVLLAGGPTQPEFSNFESVTTNNMVNPFTGDFTYNINVLEIPGANGGGYPISLSYHSGVSPEDEASWVGYGWTLNPGAITRNKRGFADDSQGDTVKYWNRVPANWTASLGGSASAELFSYDLPVNASPALYFNNYKGFSFNTSIGISTKKGLASLNYNISEGEGSFSAHINPAKTLSEIRNRHLTDQEKTATAYAHNKTQMGANLNNSRLQLFGSNYGLYKFANSPRATAVTAYTGQSFNFDASLLAAPLFLQLGPNARLSGSYSIQRNNESDKLKAFGYMYSGKAGPKDIMDYYVEKGGSYEKHDVFLGMPFSNADNFTVSGEGLNGGFRLYNKKPGHFHPNSKKSNTTIQNIGVEGEAGGNVGGGADFGEGFQTLEVKDWPNGTGNTGTYNFDFDTLTSDEPYFFRFNNDLGGSVDYCVNDTFIKGDLIVTNSVPGSKSVDLNIPGQVYPAVNNGKRPGRSSYIAYHTNEEMSAFDTPLTGKKFKAYTRDAQTNDCVKRDGGSANPINKGIGEFVIFNESGNKYTYGLPVYSRNEINMQYDVKDATIQQNYLAYKDIGSTPDIENKLRTKVGEERNTPYAVSFLLTEITSPEYIDKTGNGPTSDDFGAYTKFNYKQHYGTKASQGYKSTGSNWFKWRTPYTGLLYERNEMSNSKDDVGTVIAGEKEVYTVETIETKTHIAYFVLGSTSLTVNGIIIKGSGQSRKDGYEASDNITAANSPTARGTKVLEKLERIELYAKDANGLPSSKIKTVNFEYDYSLCPGTPNNINYNPNNPTAPNSGNLTLKKVWFDYNDVKNIKISPYIFDYSYPQSTNSNAANYLPGGYPQQYQSQFGNYMLTADQNPSYNFFDVDCWGNYQYQGATRAAKFQTWTDQTPPASGFDPAAWHLKAIKLPSKGEIHVQYEQKTYSYVQDRRAMGMVPLLSVPTNTALDKFYVDPSAIDVISSTEQARLKQLIKEQFIDKGDKMYFKFYYKLLGSGTVSVTDGSCNGEFITGYATVKEVNTDANGLYVKVVGGNELPKRVCTDFVRTNRAGLAALNGDCDPTDESPVLEPIDAVLSFAGRLSQYAASGIPGNSGGCSELSYVDSYLRLPLLKPKKGGGVRVKRLLMYDPGIEAGDKNLYGKEYIYDEIDPVSGLLQSMGVATNEPAAIREENALVGFLAREKQNFLNKIICGRDKEITEGPIGESILPGPGIGYSKTIIKNIYQGKTNPGFSINEYFTSKDYPYDMNCSYLNDGNKQAVDYTPIDEKRDWLVAPIPAFGVNITNLWLSQGFRFILNNMHGQAKSLATYGGVLSDPSSWLLSAKESYTYYEPGEKVPVSYDIHNDPVYENPGKEMEVVFEMKGIEDITKDLSIEVDGDVGLIVPPLPFGSAFPSFVYSESKLRTHTTSKIVRYPAIIKSVVKYADGIYTTTYNTAVSPYDGSTLVTTTTDGFDGLDLLESGNHNGTYRNISTPAAKEHVEMANKNINERMLIRSTSTSTLNKIINTSVSNGSKHIKIGITGASQPIIDAMSLLVPGDLIALYKSDNTLDGVYHVAEKYSFSKDLEILPTTIYKYDSVNVLSSVAIEVLRSGRTNQLTGSVASISTYGVMQKPNATTHTMSGVISAQATLLDDSWNYDKTIFGDFPHNLPTGISNPFETGERGKWRAFKNYVYKTNIIPGNKELVNPPGNTNTHGRTYNSAGVFYDFKLFQKNGGNDTTKWIATDNTKAYTPNGEATVMYNAINIYGTTKYGYNNVVPVLSSSNADYTTVQFESFETSYLSNGTTCVEDGLGLADPSMIDAVTAHSGKKSIKLTAPFLTLSLNKVIPVQQNNLFVFKTWLREDYVSNNINYVQPGQAHPYFKITFDGASGLSPVNMIKKAQVGEWSLYEGLMTVASNLSDKSFTPFFSYASAPPGHKVWLDDVRLQPLQSQMTSYVYDPVTFRLLTVFDDQHFGVYYQYNSEGKLMRKIIETERGKKTVQESQYNLPAVNRN